MTTVTIPMNIKAGCSTAGMVEREPRQRARNSAPWRSVEHIADGAGARGGEYWTLTLSCGHIGTRSKPVYRLARKMRTAPYKIRCRVCAMLAERACSTEAAF